MTAVSVALATFEGERFLGAQLESLAAQRLAPAELVVQDDGSTDGTVAVVEAFARSSPFPVRLEVNDRRLGYAENFLRAAARCSGDVVCFCDQDDVWLPHKLDRVTLALAPPGVSLAVHASRVVDEVLRPTGRRFPAIEADRLAPAQTTDPWLPLPGMAMAFSRRLAQLPHDRRPPSHDLPDAMIRHDEWIYLLARVSGTIAFVAEPLALYRQHGDNVTGAPGGGPLAFLREVRATGAGYYRARRDQASGSAAALAELGLPGADEYRELARQLDRRAPLHDRSLGRMQRLRRLGRLAAEGGYRGAGRRLLKDLAGACSG